MERHREFLGLENMNLMNIVSTTAGIVWTTVSSGKKTSKADVMTWLLKNVGWGVTSCTDLPTIEMLMKNAAAVERNPRALAVIASACER